MAHILYTIKKRSTFLFIREQGLFIKGKNFNIQVLHNQNLNDTIGVGYTATRKIGNATKRNRIKRKLKAIVLKLLKIKGAINYNYTYIVFGKTKAYKEKHNTLLSEMTKIFKKIK